MVFVDVEKAYKRVPCDLLWRAFVKKNVPEAYITIIQDMYDQLETVEGQQEIYRIAAAGDQSGKDICQISNVNSATGEVLMKDDESKERWGQYFNMLMNMENQRVETEKETPTKQ